jgi:hypothetical protein
MPIAITCRGPGLHASGEGGWGPRTTFEFSSTQGESCLHTCKILFSFVFFTEENSAQLPGAWLEVNSVRPFREQERFRRASRLVDRLTRATVPCGSLVIPWYTCSKAGRSTFDWRAGEQPHRQEFARARARRVHVHHQADVYGRRPPWGMNLLSRRKPQHGRWQHRRSLPAMWFAWSAANTTATDFFFTMNCGLNLLIKTYRSIL